MVGGEEEGAVVAEAGDADCVAVVVVHRIEWVCRSRCCCCRGGDGRDLPSDIVQEAVAGGVGINVEQEPEEGRDRVDQ